MRRLLYLAALSMLVVALTANVAFAQDDDLDCGDFNSQAEAQQNLRADPSDPNGLDAENDGVACEVTEYPNSARDEAPVQASVSPSGDLDCEDFATQEEAQAVYNQDTTDPNGLDRDQDGQACEDSLPAGSTPSDPSEPMETEEPTQSAAAPQNTMGETDGAAAPTSDANQYADDDAEEMTALPDTGGFSLGGIAAGTGALLVAGGLLLRRRLT